MAEDKKPNKKKINRPFAKGVSQGFQQATGTTSLSRLKKLLGMKQ